MSTTVDRAAKQTGTKFERVLARIRDGAAPQRYSDIADALKIPADEVVRIVDSLVAGGMNINVGRSGVELFHTLPIIRHESINIKSMKGTHHVYGVTADNHLGSKYSRLDVINALFDIWVDRGVKTVLQCGNIIDGECRFNKHDLLVHGMEEQVDYLIQNWPHRKGIVTEFVTGDDHEGWYVQREGVDIGRYIEMKAVQAGRHDLQYKGHMERQVAYIARGNKSTLSQLHAGGGTAYAISYTSQKQVESYQPGEKPTIILVGHYHKFDYSFPRAVHAIQPGCTEDQSPFMRKRRIEAMIGGVTLEFDLDGRALVNNVGVMWHPFYDRDFYNGKLWKYRWNEKP